MFAGISQAGQERLVDDDGFVIELRQDMAAAPGQALRLDRVGFNL